MTEYLYDDNKPLDPKKYRVKVGCINCDAVKLMDIKKGKTIEIFITEEKTKCPVCECKDTLISYNAYRAQRAMMNQIIDMAKKEADAERRGHGQYG